MSSGWRILCGVWMAGVIAAAFIGVGPAAGFREPEAARILFFHVPMAWLAVLGFLGAMLYAMRYLRRRDPAADIRAAASAEMGFLFCVLATLSGALFARVQWGAAWNWDPRQTSILALLLVYAAYFTLRSAIADPERRAALSSVYAILAALPMLFLVFILPRVVDSLHPGDTMRSGGMSPDYRIVFFAALCGFTLLYFWIYRLRVATEEVERSLCRHCMK
ncbi:MAG TPA: cytochrome c biogenesis protein CcsA [Armatimonadetes bacterium]|jgi:heme exporter protein C|nr:cytochrome c biogenesis protein CcsA [Armatimonadota bacterium]